MRKVTQSKFLPLWISFGIIGAGFVLAVKGIRRRLVAQGATAWPEAAGWRRVGLMLGALAVSLLLLELLGFLVTITLFMVVVIVIVLWPLLHRFLFKPVSNGRRT